MNPLSLELQFHVHKWLIISLTDFCFVIRKGQLFGHLAVDLKHIHVLQTYTSCATITFTKQGITVIEKLPTCI